MSGMTARIAHFVADLESAKIPAKTREVARHAMLDWFAVTYAGRDEPVSRIVRRMVADEGGRASSTVIGEAVLLPARAAALANGATSHALDYDDTHWDYVGHPSVAVFPAVFALAEQTGASGAALIEAFVIGAETACRVGRWLGDSHYALGFHQTATSGARLLGLDAERTRHALSIAATRASGLKSMFGTMGKPYHAGMAAANGVEAAQLAALGFAGREDALECAQGFAATHGGSMANPDDVLTGLGGEFRFDLVQFKYHACCYGTHAAIEALHLLRRRWEAEGKSVNDIASVDLAVHPKWLSVCNIPAPVTGLEAKFSYRATAAMVMRGIDTADPCAFNAGVMADPALICLRDKVRVIGNDAIADCAVEAAISGAGEILHQRYDLSGVVPLELQHQKLMTKAKSLLDDTEFSRISAFLDGLEQANGIHAGGGASI